MGGTRRYKSEGLREPRSSPRVHPNSIYEMRAARYYGPGDIRIEDIPEPEIKPGQIKLKVNDTQLDRSILPIHERYY